MYGYGRLNGLGSEIDTKIDVSYSSFYRGEFLMLVFIGHVAFDMDLR